LFSLAATDGRQEMVKSRSTTSHAISMRQAGNEGGSSHKAGRRWRRVHSHGSAHSSSRPVPPNARQLSPTPTISHAGSPPDTLGYSYRHGVRHHKQSVFAGYLPLKALPSYTVPIRVLPASFSSGSLYLNWQLPRLESRLCGMGSDISLMKEISVRLRSFLPDTQTSSSSL
jgi:hypothetical protein